MSEIKLSSPPSQGYFGIASYPPGGTHGPRIQRGIQLFYVISGYVDITVDGVSSRLHPGHIALLQPQRHEFFNYCADQGTVHSWCQLDFDTLPKDLHQLFDNVPISLVVNTEIEQLLELGLAMTGAEHFDNRVALIKLGEALLHYYLSLAKIPENQRTQALPRVVRQACNIVAECYSTPLTVRRLASDVHCSSNHLINQFKKSLGVTPARYLWKVRLSHAESLLKHTDIPIAAVSEQCGFMSAFHFSRLFKETTTSSPREFRILYRKGVIV